MKRFFWAFLAMALTSSAVAENKQTICVGGQPVGKVVKQITFDGDNLELTFTDESTLQEDMSLVSLSFVYGDVTGISKPEVARSTVWQGKVFNLNGQLVGTTTAGLSKGIYIVNGKKMIVK